jgi:hypothetical protein
MHDCRPANLVVVAKLLQTSKGSLHVSGYRMTRLIKVDLIVWIIIHAFGGSSVTSKIQVYLVIVTHACPRESTLLNKYLHTFSSGFAVMWDTCKGWWEGKIKVEVDEVLLLHRSRPNTQHGPPTIAAGRSCGANSYYAPYRTQ